MKKIEIFLFVIWMATLAVMAGCGQSATPVQKMGDVSYGDVDGLPDRATSPVVLQGNILMNAGFENGTETWQWLDWSKGWAAFKHATDHSYEGNGSLYLPLKSDERPTVVWGAVQEITLDDDIPECVEGYYYIEQWHSGDWKQYLQVVIIDLSHSLGEKMGQAQLRYIVSGTTTPPLNISNAQYLFVETHRRETPVLKQWTKFSFNPRADFEKNWNYKPTKGAKLRVLFEARYDHHRKQQNPVLADVYFDNLYMGPKTATRCAD
ncbi:MAG: hypothetical protein IIY06_00980 [Proteobacteria bacterium]|nr:hypothetical protein [Pseudomonadota bacterium]